MTQASIVRRSQPSAMRPLAALLLLCGAASVTAGAQARNASAPADTADPRIGLSAGLTDAGQAMRGLRLVAHKPRPEGFTSQRLGDFGVANSDLAFAGNFAYQGNFNGWQIWDISNPANPTVRATLVCPGGQGDLSVYRNLLFMSVEETRGRVDCGTGAIQDTVSTDRFRGVRIFDITDPATPRQIASVQTCRGSHTHTLVTDPKDTANVYIYVAGTAGSRPVGELAGCVGNAPLTDPNNPYFRIEVIQVPLAAPQTARIVSMPRIFADTAGNIAGLWRGGRHGEGTQQTSQTNQCHDITVFTEIGLAAGACSGNGILLDISDPANPKRIDEVIDPNFAYWHSATFNNDGTKVIYTDEWGGGTAARCRPTDRREWGANAIFTLTDRRLRHASYYKLPAPQTATENCVAHNGSIIPIPGRDVMVQAWYQGGVSVFDFTDPENPREIAFFDRGPLSAAELALGGAWSSYWYNGHIYSSEIGRGLDVLELVPGEHLSRNEIDAAKLVRVASFNPQDQRRHVWPASFVVARAYLDQLLREDGLRSAWVAAARRDLAAAERTSGSRRRTALTALATRIERDAATAGDAPRVRALAASIRQLAGGTR